MLAEKISSIPLKSGVYIFKDRKDKILYVGKAKNLRNRLRSYFRKTADLDQRKTAMVKLITDFSYVVTENELEALILEANLIKQYKPPFNVVLRDDKNYPYLKLTMNEEWPRIEVVRKIIKDGSIYFGPYVPAQSMWEALAFIRRNFPIRTCAHSLDKPVRPCIQYQIGRCPAPCGRKITRRDYMKIVEEIRLFLSGQRTELLKSLEEKMNTLSASLKFEEAAHMRDRIKNIKRAWESQRAIAPELGDMDIIGFYSGDGDALFDVFFVRNGVLIGTKDFFVKDSGDLKREEILESFLELFYSKEIIPPSEILVPNKPKDLGSLKAWLKKRKGSAVQIKVPREGKKAELLKMASENAEQLFNNKKISTDNILKTIRNRLNLVSAPHGIGAFDVSTIAGSDSVGAFVYWSDGQFRKELYRRIRVKGVSGIDDYAMMNEVISRTLKNLAEKIPDLILIDGGRGQLEIAKKIVERETVTCENGQEPFLVAIAKDPDRAITLTHETVGLEDGSPSSLLLKKIRDEVHRFAVTYHRKLRDRRLLESPLERVRGIGKKRRFELLRFFGSIDAIRNASIEEIAKLRGFNRKIAEHLANELRRR